jgi:predicted CXXCH cytochrome family protein
MKHQLLPALMLLLLFATICATARADSIVDSPHNLSVSGPGMVRAVSEDRVCIFCHTPHGARTNAPLWNRRDSAAFYQPYDSPTITAKPGQPTGSSKLCLSCHDGTVAMGDLVSEGSPIAMSGGGTMPPGGSRIGTDLRDDHPVSFSYAASLSRPRGELAPPHSWDPAIKLDPHGMLQCTTCHDPHDNQWDKFLVMDNTNAALCRECHVIDQFDNSPHALSTKTWNGGGKDPWPHTDNTDVASNACMNCHQSHHAPSQAELLTAARDEQLCLNCHDGSVADAGVGASFRKPYRHPIVETSSGHRPGEMLSGTAGHVTCVDCHNPHKTGNSRRDAPFVFGLMEGVSGVTEAGTIIEEAMFEYEVCFKCHAEDSGSRFQSINRQVATNNIRRQFAVGSASSHPVVSAETSSRVPSLISPWREDSMIRCSDCHGDDAPSASGMGKSGGVHGSRHRFLLVKEYQTGDNIFESPNAYALCYACHSRSSILGDQSFSGHSRHIVNERTPCSVCHTAHGVDGISGNSINNASLINFDLGVVQPLPSSMVLEYRSFGDQSGTCTLRCHGKDHVDAVY